MVAAVEAISESKANGRLRSRGFGSWSAVSGDCSGFRSRSGVWSPAAAGTTPLVDNLYQGMALDPVTGLYYERARSYSPSLGTWISQDPAGYINGANTYQFVMGNPVGRVDPSGDSWYDPQSWDWVQTAEATVGDAVGANGAAVAGAFWSGAAQGAQGGASIVSNTITFGVTDDLGATNSSQYQGGAYTLSRDFAQAGRAGLEMAATGGLSGLAMRGAETLGATGLLSQALAAGGTSGLMNGGFQSLNNISDGQPWSNGVVGAAAGGFVGGSLGGGLSALRAGNLAARQAGMSFGMLNLLRGFAEMNPQFVRDASNNVAMGNLAYDFLTEGVSELGKIFVEGFFGGVGSQSAPCKDAR